MGLQDEAVEEIIELLKKNQALDEQLRLKLNDVETTLYHGHVMTAALSKYELKANAFARSTQHRAHAPAGSQMS
jgi:predicted phosphodiesterase